MLLRLALRLRRGAVLGLAAAAADQQPDEGCQGGEAGERADYYAGDGAGADLALLLAACAAAAAAATAGAGVGGCR